MNLFEIFFTVPGAAVPKGRPKFARRGNFTVAYTPEKTVSFENLVKSRADDAMNGQQMHMGPVSANIVIALPVPTSWSKKNKEAALLGRIAPTKKPDSDNVIKAIFDAMNGIVFKDDAQVVVLTTSKVYAQSPSTLVQIKSTGQEAAK